MTCRGSSRVLTALLTLHPLTTAGYFIRICFSRFVCYGCSTGWSRSANLWAALPRVPVCSHRGGSRRPVTVVDGSSGVWVNTQHTRHACGWKCFVCGDVLHRVLVLWLLVCAACWQGNSCASGGPVSRQFSVMWCTGSAHRVGGLEGVRFS